MNKMITLAESMEEVKRHNQVKNYIWKRKLTSIINDNLDYYNENILLLTAAA